MLNLLQRTDYRLVGPEGAPGHRAVEGFLPAGTHRNSASDGGPYDAPVGAQHPAAGDATVAPTTSG